MTTGCGDRGQINLVGGEPDRPAAPSPSRDVDLTESTFHGAATGTLSGQSRHADGFQHRDTTGTWSRRPADLDLHGRDSSDCVSGGRPDQDRKLRSSRSTTSTAAYRHPDRHRHHHRHQRWAGDHRATNPAPSPRARRQLGAGHPTVSGTITFNDQDLGDTLTLSVTGNATALTAALCRRRTPSTFRR